MKVNKNINVSVAVAIDLLTNSQFDEIQSILDSALKGIDTHFKNDASAHLSKGFAAEYLHCAEFNLDALLKGKDFTAIMPPVAADGKQHIADIIIVHKAKAAGIMAEVTNGGRLDLPEGALKHIQMKVGGESYLGSAFNNHKYDGLELVTNGDGVSELLSKVKSVNPEMYNRIKHTISYDGVSSEKVSKEQLFDAMQNDEDYQKLVEHLKERAKDVKQAKYWENLSKGLGITIGLSAAVSFATDANKIHKSGYDSKIIQESGAKAALAGIEGGAKFALGEGIKQVTSKAGSQVLSKAGPAAVAASVVYEGAKDINKVRKGDMSKRTATSNASGRVLIGTSGLLAASLASGGAVPVIIVAGVCGSAAGTLVNSGVKRLGKWMRQSVTEERFT